MRLIELDSYVAAPVPSLDPSHSLFSSSPLTHVPVLRVWGATPAGQRTCLHVHRYFPYLYVPMPASVPDEEREEKDFMRRLGLSLEMALREVDARRRQEQQRDAPHSPAEHLYSLTLHTATDFYGYHAHRGRFIRLSLLSPASVSTAASILLSGALLGQSFQPYEAHIPYTLQFMVDAGLAGMDFLDLSWCGVRRWRRGEAETAAHSSGRDAAKRGLDTGMTWADWNQRQAAARESKEEGKAAAAAGKDEAGREAAQAAEEEQMDDADPSAATVSSSPPLPAFTATPLSSRLYLPSTLPLSLYVPGRVPRLTHCQLEADCSFYHIINRGRGVKEKERGRAAAAGAEEEKVQAEEGREARTAARDGKKRLVRSLQLLWENEKERRRLWQQEQQQRRQRRRKRRAAAAEAEELASTPSAPALDFSQIASSPPRQPPPLSELELALRRHLHAVARQEKPLSQPSTPTPSAPALEPQTVAAKLKQEEERQTVEQQETRSAEEAAAAGEDELEAAATAVLQGEDAERDEEEEEAKEEEDDGQLGRLLQSALANAEAELPPVAAARLPGVSSLLSSQPPVEEEQQVAAGSQRVQRPAAEAEQEQKRRADEDEWVMTQVQQEMEERAEVDERLLLASQRQLRQQQEEEQQSRLQRQEWEEQRLHGEEEEEQQADDGTQQEADWEMEREAAAAAKQRGGSGSGSGGSRGSGRGRIVIEDDEQPEQPDDANFSFVRIAQLDGAGDSEGELEASTQRRQSRRQSGGSGSKRAAQLVTSFSHRSRYSAIPLTPVVVRPAEPAEGREEEEEEDVVMIPATPPTATSRLFPRSPSPVASASPSPARHRAGSRLTQSGSGARRRRRSQVRRSGTGGSAGTGRVRRSPATTTAAVSTLAGAAAGCCLCSMLLSQRSPQLRRSRRRSRGEAAAAGTKGSSRPRTLRRRSQPTRRAPMCKTRTTRRSGWTAAQRRRARGASRSWQRTRCRSSAAATRRTARSARSTPSLGLLSSLLRSRGQPQQMTTTTRWLLWTTASTRSSRPSRRQPLRAMRLFGLQRLPLSSLPHVRALLSHSARCPHRLRCL